MIPVFARIRERRLQPETTPAAAAAAAVVVVASPLLFVRGMTLFVAALRPIGPFLRFAVVRWLDDRESLGPELLFFGDFCNVCVACRFSFLFCCAEKALQRVVLFPQLVRPFVCFRV